MIIKLKYSYYKKKPVVNGHVKFKEGDFVEGTFDFDTKTYRNDEGNYRNVVSDHLLKNGVKEKHSLYIAKIK